MIDRQGVRMLTGVFVGTIIGAFITAFTHPIVQIIVLVALSLSLVIDWNKLSKNKKKKNHENNQRRQASAKREEDGVPQMRVRVHVRTVRHTFRPTGWLLGRMPNV